ncbi:MAG: abortive infection family protein [Deltaproteobacteria bacterium]|nr:abortive infection family protein [Deltaproteobacteria bacterium]
MRLEIPSPIISLIAEAIASNETHATLDSLFMYAGAPGEPPLGSKHAKALAWLRIINKDQSVNPLEILGKLIEGYMDAVDQLNSLSLNVQEHKDKISKALMQFELQYIKGGKIIGTLGIPSRSLEHVIRAKDVSSINDEFDRALKNIESNPREAVSAACNILESICKAYIEDEGLEMPSKQDLQHVWTVVRKDLGFDPGLIEDRDLQEILSGLIAVVNGIGALRTHASSAHGAGKKHYKLESRHVRLTVHAAHTIALFVIESWEKKLAKKK